MPSSCPWSSVILTSCSGGGMSGKRRARIVIANLGGRRLVSKNNEAFFPTNQIPHVSARDQSPINTKAEPPTLLGLSSVPTEGGSVGTISPCSSSAMRSTRGQFSLGTTSIISEL